MIYFLYGENSFGIRRAVEAIVGQFDGDAERYDGESLTLAGLPDILMGGTLFAAKRLVIVRYLSENKTVWEVVPDWLERIDDDVTLVLIEGKPDKRTRTYKALQKIASSQEFAAWTERDGRKAEQWVQSEAVSRGINLDEKMVQLLVQRSGVDQWRLHNDLEKLAALDEVSLEIIQEVIAPHPTESVFELFEAALKGNTARLETILRTLKTSEEPYMVFGLLSGQVFQLAAVASSNKPTADIAKDIGAHPYAVSKLAEQARRKSIHDIRRIVAAFDDSDELMKTSAIDPWLAVERALSITAAV